MEQQWKARQRPLDAAEVRRLEAALAFVRENYVKGVTLAEAAAVAGWSPFHFHRVFKQWHGKTAKQVITEMRIEQAKRLILAGQPIPKVAAQCGYAHASHLGLRFMMATTESPTRWRRRVRAGTLAA